MLVCHCTLSGTAACRECPKYLIYFNMPAVTPITPYWITYPQPQEDSERAFLRGRIHELEKRIAELEKNVTPPATIPRSPVTISR